MEKNGSGSAHASTYGQACLQCFKAKCRCVPRSDGDTCERCFRLRKACQRSDSARRRSAQKPQESDARIAQLESKIETLLSVLQPAIGSPNIPTDLRRLLNENKIPSSVAGSKGAWTNSDGTPPTDGEVPTPATESLPAEPPGPIPFPPDSQVSTPSGTSFRQAETCFDVFQHRMLPCFPFITLAPGLTVWQLRHERPILFQAIITVATFSTREKLAYAEEFTRIVFTSALLNAQSSIDLLLGILTYLAWSTDAFLGRGDVLSRLMMLAISIVYDLRLFKPSPPDAKLIVAITQGFAENDQNTDGETVQGFMEQQRAVLACFVISSNMSSHFGRIDALRWTPRMEEALQLLQTNKSCESDEGFALQVRLHLLTQRATRIREQHEADRTSSANANVPELLYLKLLRTQLGEFRASISSNLPQQDILFAYAQYVDLYINQAAQSVAIDASHGTSGRGVGSSPLPGFERLDCMWRSVEAIKAWVDVFQKVSPAEYVGLPFHFWSQTVRCITILKYLSTLEEASWDCQAVRNTVNVMLVLDWMPKKLDLATNQAGLQSNEDDLFKLLSRLLQRSRGWAEARWNNAPQVQGKEGARSRDTEFGATTTDSNMPDFDPMAWMYSMDLDSDKWFEDVLGWSSANS